MKKLTANQLEVLNGGICRIMPEPAHMDCQPTTCHGAFVAFIASGGNPNIPVFICPA